MPGSPAPATLRLFLEAPSSQLTSGYLTQIHTRPKPPQTARLPPETPCVVRTDRPATLPPAAVPRETTHKPRPPTAHPSPWHSEQSAEPAAQRSPPFRR